MATLTDDYWTAEYRRALGAGYYHETAAEREARLAACFGDRIGPELADSFADTERSKAFRLQDQLAEERTEKLDAQDDYAELRDAIEELFKTLKPNLTIEHKHTIRDFARKHGLDDASLWTL